MSTVPPSVPTIPPATSKREEIKLISHSNLFYWWPVWFTAFVMAGWTYVEGHRMAVVPSGAEVVKTEAGYTLKYPAGAGTTTQLDRAVRVAGSSEHAFRPRVSQNAVPGVLFSVVLLVTIFVTNVPLRGLWTFLTLALIVVLALFISLLKLWDSIFEAVGALHIHMNLAFYLFIGLCVFVLWAVAVFVFDRRTYIIFTPGQIRVCEHIGDSVQTFPTTGVSLEKLRDDIFRHYILGFGSGDLVVRVGGNQPREIRMPNVLGIGWQLKEVENVLASVKVA
jgi:hypothetical protein